MNEEEIQLGGRGKCLISESEPDTNGIPELAKVLRRRNVARCKEYIKINWGWSSQLE